MLARCYSKTEFVQRGFSFCAVKCSCLGLITSRLDHVQVQQPTPEQLNTQLNFEPPADSTFVVFFGTTYEYSFVPNAKITDLKTGLGDSKNPKGRLQTAISDMKQYVNNRLNQNGAEALIWC